MNTQSSLAAQLSSKEYRDAFVASQLRIGLPMQCRALRESREWTQPQLAEAAGMSQPRISEIERPGERKLNLETLLRLASAFDVALQVRFVPFSRLVDDDDALNFSSFYVRSFEEDIAQLEKQEEQMKKVITFRSPLEDLMKQVGQGEDKGTAENLLSKTVNREEVHADNRNQTRESDRFRGHLRVESSGSGILALACAAAG